MNALVNKADLDQYKYVADSVKNLTIWGQFVLEAQQFDVKNWLGDALLNELSNQAVPDKFTALNLTLLNGGSYSYNDCTYLFQGLRAAIIYYAFARYTNYMAYNYTAAGIVIKESDYSTPVGDKITQRLETDSRLKAEAIRDEVVLYLCRFSDDYPLWRNGNCGCGMRDNRTRTFKVLGD